MADHSDLVARLNAVIPYQGKSNVAFLCHEAAALIETQAAEIEALRRYYEAVELARHTDGAIHWDRVTMLATAIEAGSHLEEGV